MYELFLRIAGMLAAASFLLAPAKVSDTSAIPFFEISLASAAAIAVQASTTPPAATTTLQELASTTAARYGVSGSDMAKVISCESGWSASAQSGYLDPSGPNGRENSWGIAQINLDAHPEVTRAEATDPAWALDWMARQWAAGDARLWTCYRKLIHT